MLSAQSKMKVMTVQWFLKYMPMIYACVKWICSFLKLVLSRYSITAHAILIAKMVFTTNGPFSRSINCFKISFDLFCPLFHFYLLFLFVPFICFSSLSSAHQPPFIIWTLYLFHSSWLRWRCLHSIPSHAYIVIVTWLSLYSQLKRTAAAVETSVEDYI